MKNSYLFVLILMLFAVFWIWWLPGPRVANDFSFISNDWLKLQFDIPRTWNERGAEGLGEYGVFILWSYPINILFGVLSYLGISFEIWERVLVIVFIFFGAFSIWKTIGSYGLSNKSKFIGSLFYLINTYPILLIDGGQISIALAYGVFPFTYLYIKEAVKLGYRKKISAGLLVTLLGYFDIRFIYILLLLLILQMAFDAKNFLKWLKGGVFIGLIVFLLNCFWLLTYIKIPVEDNVISSFSKISTNLLNIGHPILVISPHWYKNVFGKISQLRWEFILLPLLVFLAPILYRKSKVVLFWLFVALVGIFLTKGGAEPLSFVYPFLHSKVPGFFFFRDSTKFFFLVSLSYAVLISMTSEEFFKRFQKKSFQSIYLLLITVYLMYLIRPIFLNQMTGTFSVQPFEKEFQSLSNVLTSDANFGRVFWIPATAPLSYSDLNHPVVEASRVFNKIPFDFGSKGNYEVFNFLREASYMGEIFDVAGISYIAYPYPNTRRETLSLDDVRYYYTFLNQLMNLPWIAGKSSVSQVPLLVTKNHQDKIFLAKNIWITFGTDELFKEATKSSKLRLSNNAVIFAEKGPEEGPLLLKYPEAKVLLNGKTLIDLIATFIPISQIIFPADQLSANPDQDGWWKNDGKDLLSWRDFLQSKYGIDNKDFDLGGGWAIGEKSSKFKVQNSRFKKNNILMVRAMESSRSGSLMFYQDNEPVGSIDTKAQDTMVRWFEVGALPKTGDLTIETSGDINVINTVASIDQKDLLGYKQNAESLLKRVADFKPVNASESKPSIVYKRMNQTKYKVTISNLTSPSMVVFSSSFHSGWKLEGENSIPVYGFLNGFRVDKDGQYEIGFSPQKNILPGMLVSLFTLIILIILLFV